MSIAEGLPSKPDWLNDDFVKNCVKNDVGASSIEDVVVHSIGIEYVVPKGENYCSLIYRLNVEADVYDKNRNKNVNPTNSISKLDNDLTNGDSNSNKRRYIVKVLHDYDFMKEFTEEMAMHFKEVDMYKNVVPKYQTILKNANLDTTFACRCLHVYDEKNAFVMDDLGAQNYILANRINGMNLDHTKLVLFKMARFHGASMKCSEQNGLKDVSENYFKPMVRKIEDEKLKAVMDPIFGEEVVSKKILELAEDINKRPGYEEEVEILRKISDHGHDILCGVFKYEPGNNLNTLLHGDCWINNMLFKYNDVGIPIDVMLLDLQCAYYSNVANEFMYFFLSSTDDEVRKHNYHDVVNFYYQNLIETLDKVKYKGNIPSLRQLNEALVVSSPLMLFILTVMLVAVKKEFNGANDRSESKYIKVEDIIDLGEKSRNNPIYVKTLFITVDTMKKMGAFQELQKLDKIYQK